MANSSIVSMKSLLEAETFHFEDADPSVEPQDGSLYLYRAQRHLYC